MLTTVLLFSACDWDSDDKGKNDPPAPPKVEVEVPTFNADSAYYYIEKQVSFGPRVPNTEPHRLTGDWLIERLESTTGKVYVQEGKVQAFDGTQLEFRNIIGAINPQAKKRILLCAHWDTRPFADNDNDPDNWHKAIDGANDGGSGVGVLLEVARILNEQPIDIGVDIVFFDVEDYGQPEFSELPRKQDSWALGSQYWSKKPHVPGYKAKYGILLDMVGGKGSKFKKEGTSMQFASSVVNKVWKAAADAGYSSYFVFQNAKAITDDHYYVNVHAKIPTIDIIHLGPGGYQTFHPSWHTQDDNMEVIDKNVLKAVGQTVLEVIYREDKGAL